MGIIEDVVRVLRAPEERKEGQKMMFITTPDAAIGAANTAGFTADVARAFAFSAALQPFTSTQLTA